MQGRQVERAGRTFKICQQKNWTQNLDAVIFAASIADTGQQCGDVGRAKNGMMLLSRYTQNICITFIQCWTSVFDVGPTLYNCYTNVSCLLGCLLGNASHAPSGGPALDWSEWSYGHVMIDVRAEGQPVSGSLTTDPHVLTPGQDDRFTGWTWYSMVTVQGHYQQQQVLSVQWFIQITDHMGSYSRTSYDISWISWIYRRLRIGRDDQDSNYTLSHLTWPRIL